NKAAREMKERLHSLIGGSRADSLSVGTFHSLCTRFLRRDIPHLGRERDFAIYDSDDQERLMRRVLRDLNLDEKKNPPRAMLARVSSAKNELVGPAEFARVNRSYHDEIVTRCYERYQALLQESNALDFDDLLFETVNLFEYHPDVLAKYHERYIYLLVDEYQDTNRAQYVLVKQLAAMRRNLFVVGDNDQGVYSWRGADIRNILQFEDDYPEAQVILLEQNYRSSQAILDLAQAVISGGAKRKHVKKLWTENGTGMQVSLQEAYNQEEEGQLVADEIRRLVATGDYRLRDCAIMYRTNAQSRAVEEALIRQHLDYQIIGGTRFYERKEVKDVLAYMRLAYNPFDSVSLTRVLNWPGRGIGERTEAELGRWATELGVPIFQALRELETQEPRTKNREPGAGVSALQSPFNARTTQALLGFRTLVEGMLEARTRLDLPALLDYILAQVGVREALLREYEPQEAEDRWGNVLELCEVTADYVNLPQENQLGTFLEEVALVSEVDKLDADADKITCITLHQAKGLEYPAVFLVGLEEGLLPHSRSQDDRDALEEERRLFYVGITRAKQRLYLLYAFRRSSYGRTNLSVPTRFLKDVPPGMLKTPTKRQQTMVPQTSMFTERGFGGAGSRGSSAPASRERRPSGPSEISFHPGQRVRHGTFGEGVVVSSRLVEGDEEVTVNFSGRGEKKLLASFARLERM
nr:UvrD-helicase domain-containing protein [Chloroflexaceae bacterium]